MIDVRSWVEENAGSKFRYIGNDDFYKNKEGSFELWEDMNCCAPTQDFLVVFDCGDCRKVMNPDEFDLDEFEAATRNE